ncbi:MAG: hypothetical protein IKO93_06455 [Lentisphaeria bacterium]|nr:hypothetical protein [Lentisphaeria bacterium]
MNTTQKKTLRNIIRIVLSLLFLAVGVSALVWSLVCFAGGPDGKAGSSDPLVFGAVFLLASILCGAVFLLLNWKKRWALASLIVLYEMPLLFFTQFVTFYVMVGTHIYGANWSHFLQLSLLWGIIIAGGIALFRLTKKPA